MLFDFRFYGDSSLKRKIDEVTGRPHGLNDSIQTMSTKKQKKHDASLPLLDEAMSVIDQYLPKYIRSIAYFLFHFL